MLFISASVLQSYLPMYNYLWTLAMVCVCGKKVVINWYC